MSVLVEIKNLKKYFPVKKGILSKVEKVVHAVDGISFDIRERENFGLAGESGCGKTTLGRVILRLYEPTEGTVRFEGRNVFELNKTDMRKLRREMQIVFQNPFDSLNPRKTLYQILSQPFGIHKVIDKHEVRAKVLELLEEVGLGPVELFADRYPRELSGGQRQRVGIARAVALRPKFIVADEPVSSLDMSVRATILSLMKQLQEEYRLAYLFITHELAVLRSMCNRVGIMYLGKIVELANTKELFDNPLHPYTIALLSATPIPNPKVTRAKKRIALKGELPSPIDPPPGCRFHTRCPNCRSKCTKIEPELIRVGDNHFVACHSVV